MIFSVAVFAERNTSNTLHLYHKVIIISHLLTKIKDASKKNNISYMY